MIVERTNVNKHVLILILNAIAQSFTFLLYGKFWDNSEVYMWSDFFFLFAYFADVTKASTPEK